MQSIQPNWAARYSDKKIKMNITCSKEILRISFLLWKWEALSESFPSAAIWGIMKLFKITIGIQNFKKLIKLMILSLQKLLWKLKMPNICSYMYSKSTHTIVGIYSWIEKWWYQTAEYGMLWMHLTEHRIS